jgi:hypothetical protein
MTLGQLEQLAHRALGGLAPILHAGAVQTTERAVMALPPPAAARGFELDRGPTAAAVER